MSMTQVAFLKKADLPNKLEIEKTIRGLGYEFEINDDFEKFYGIDGIECSINGQKTFFEIYFDQPTVITNDFEFIKKDLTDQDTAVSFIWGADFGAGASIGLISVALIDRCNALIYYLDDEMNYSREMLLSDNHKFIEELEKEKKQSKQTQINEPEVTSNKKGFWNGIKKLFK